MTEYALHEHLQNLWSTTVSTELEQFERSDLQRVNEVIAIQQAISDFMSLRDDLGLDDRDPNFVYLRATIVPSLHRWEELFEMFRGGALEVRIDDSVLWKLVSLALSAPVHEDRLKYITSLAHVLKRVSLKLEQLKAYCEQGASFSATQEAGVDVHLELLRFLSDLLHFTRNNDLLDSTIIDQKLDQLLLPLLDSIDEASNRINKHIKQSKVLRKLRKYQDA